MIKPGVDNLINWLRINKIVSWHISATDGSGQDNTRIFTSDPDSSIESEFERMRQTLELTENPVLYIFGKSKADSKVGNYKERWSNGNPQSMQEPQRPYQAMYGTPTYVCREELDERISEAVARERYNVERAAFDAEKAAFVAEKKEFEDVKNSAIGIAVEKLAPFIGSFFQGMAGDRRIAVSGTNTIQAAPIQAQPVSTIQEPVEQDTMDELPFTVEEQERITEILERYKNYDPEYLDVLAKFVDIAVKGQPISVMNGMVKLSYNDVKTFIINS